MEDSSITQWLEWIQANPWWAMFIAFVISLLESLAVLGLFIPGIVLLFAVGAIVGTDPQALIMVCLGVSVGAIVGDSISWWLGYRYSNRLPYVWPFASRPHLVEGGRIFFDRHGGKSIFIGRFIGALRPVIPVVGGILRMRPAVFFRMDIPAGILWGPIYIVPGALFGASLELASEFAGRLALVIAIVVGGVWIIAWSVRIAYEGAARRSAWWLKSAVSWSRRHPLMGRIVGPILDPSKPDVISIAMLGALLALSVAVLLAVLVLAPFGTPAWDAERRAAGLAASLRNHFADPVFVAISLAGDDRVMGLLAGGFSLILLAIRRGNSAWHWMAAIIGAWGLALVLNGFMGLLLDRPDEQLALGQVPHVGFTLATAVFGFFALQLAKDLSARMRKWPYLVTAMVLALIGFSHFYLGRASVSGLLAGLTVATGWLALVGIAYRQRARVRGRPLALLGVFYAGFLAIGSAHVNTHYESTLNASLLSQPMRTIDDSQWWTGEWASLQQYRSRIGPALVQRFDLQLAGDLNQVRRQLLQAGWKPTVAPSAMGLANMFGGPRRHEEIPHFPRDFAGRPEDLALRIDLDDERMLILRLWASGVTLSESGDPVWLGQVRPMAPGSFLGMVTLWRPAAYQTGDLERLQDGLEEWSWTNPEGGPWLVRPSED